MNPNCWTPHNASLLANFPVPGKFLWLDHRKKIKEDDYSSGLGNISIWCCYLKANRPTWKSHLWATQSSNRGNWEAGCCSSSFRSPGAADQCYNNGSSSPLVNTLYWVTQRICFQFAYSWNLAYNFSSTASVEIFIRRGKTVNKIHQSWIWFQAWPLTQAIIMQTATGLSDFMHKDLLSCRAGATIQDFGGTSPCLSISLHVKYL